MAKWIIQLVNALDYIHTQGFFLGAIAGGNIVVNAEDDLLIDP